MSESLTKPLLSIHDAAEAALIAGARDTKPVRGLTHGLCVPKIRFDVDAGNGRGKLAA